MTNDKRNRKYTTQKPKSEKSPGRLQKIYYAVGIAAAIGAVLLWYIDHQELKNAQETSAQPGFYVELVPFDSLGKYTSYFWEDSSKNAIRYKYRFQNKSKYQITNVQMWSGLHARSQYDLPDKSQADNTQLNSLAPEETGHAWGKAFPGTPIWKSFGKFYLHIWVDFTAINERKYRYQKTYYLLFRDYRTNGVKEYFNFETGQESSSLRLLK